MSDDKDQMTAWWEHHVNNTRQYVNGTFNKNPQQALKAVNELWDGVLKWCELVDDPLASALMGEHTILAKTLVDAAERGLRPGEAELVTERFMKNADDQAGFYASKIAGFPKDEFAQLFKGHIAATGAYILDAGRGDIPSLNQNYAKVLANRDQLAQFSKKYFAPPGSEPVGDLFGTGVF